ncbi:MAG TPA: SRPBCC family protein [Chloroflexota bacterium]|jgi:uncharacterized membrane protein|nr:SRPBCC family protein [Chloroflexota bacterium]
MQRAERSIRVNAPVDQVYRFWRNFENFPRFMDHVEEVRSLDAEGRLSHWKLKGGMGVTVEFDARLTQDEPGRAIGWNSTEGSLQTSGAVTFTDLQNGYTEVHVVMQWYDPPGGPVGEFLSRLLQNPERMLEEDLQRFKKIVESAVGTAAHQSHPTHP